MRLIDWLTFGISLVGLILIPIFVLLLKSVNKASSNEQKLNDLIDSKDETHRMLASMMEKMDKRVRWIEERLWGRHSG